MKAVILAGGLGTRLRPLTYVMPKAMLPVGNKPLLEHIIEFLKKQQTYDIVLATGYLGRFIEEYFADGIKWGVSLTYKVSRPLGTAGQLKTASDELTETFLAMNGDILIDVNIEAMKKKHIESGAMVTVAVREFQYKLKYGILEFGSDDVITSWNEKPSKSSWMNVGLYLMEPSVLDMIPSESVSSLEYDIFPEVIKRGHHLFSFKTDTNYLDIGDLASLDAANQEAENREFWVS
ncbi:MAG: nucleotidyltransferase family protein [Thaumarchaeota archaeon]|nr:nucleotidyltransferase family protein [Nitrososphaerota archaeon]